MATVTAVFTKDIYIRGETIRVDFTWTNATYCQSDPSGNRVYMYLNNPSGQTISSKASTLANGSDSITYTTGGSTPLGTYTASILAYNNSLNCTVNSTTDTCQLQAAALYWGISTTSIAFGNVIVGGYSDPFTVYVYNESDTYLAFTITSSDATHFIISTTSLSVPPYVGRPFNVQFHPTAAQTYNGTITVTCTTTGGSPGSRAISVSGTGIQQTYYTLTMNISPSGAGQITADPPYIICPPNCQTTYLPGTSVLLRAVSYGNYIFNQWSGDASGTNTQTNIIMNGNKNVTANFILRETIGDIDIPGSIFYASFTQNEQNALIAQIRLMNTGGADGLIYTKYFYQLPGGAWQLLVGPFQQTIAAGDSTWAFHRGNIPDISGNVLFGVKVWGEDETEPGLLLTFGVNFINNITDNIKW